MILKKVDARGLVCPQPVIETKNVLDSLQQGSVEVLVDNAAAAENVSRLAQKMGCNYEVEKCQEHYRIKINKEKENTMVYPELSSPVFACNSNLPQVLFITSQYFGKGNDELGSILMRSFFYTLTETEAHIKTVLLINSGVYLACAGSQVLDYLKQLHDQGVEVLACGTCLNYYQLEGELAVGKVTNMYTIVEYLTSQGRQVVTI